MHIKRPQGGEGKGEEEWGGKRKREEEEVVVGKNMSAKGGSWWRVSFSLHISRENSFLVVSRRENG